MNSLRENESGNGARSQEPVVGIKDLSQTGLTSLDQWIAKGAPTTVHSVEICDSTKHFAHN